MGKLKSREFGGKTYFFARSCTTKKEAQGRAKSFRSRGERLARITKEIDGYAIWVRGG